MIIRMKIITMITSLTIMIMIMISTISLLIIMMFYNQVIAGGKGLARLAALLRGEEVRAAGKSLS